MELAYMIRYPHDMIELRYAKRHIKVSTDIQTDVVKLQYRIKNVSIVDYTETWTEWTDVPTVIINE